MKCHQVLSSIVPIGSVCQRWPGIPAHKPETRMNPFQLMLDHNIARMKKRHWIEKAKGLKGIFEPMSQLHAHNWIRREVATRTNLYEAMDRIISNKQLYEDLNYEPQRRD